MSRLCWTAVSLAWSELIVPSKPWICLLSDLIAERSPFALCWPAEYRLARSPRLTPALVTNRDNRQRGCQDP